MHPFFHHVSVRPALLNWAAFCCAACAAQAEATAALCDFFAFCSAARPQLSFAPNDPNVLRFAAPALSPHAAATYVPAPSSFGAGSYGAVYALRRAAGEGARGGAAALLPKELCMKVVASEEEAAKEGMGAALLDEAGLLGKARSSRGSRAPARKQHSWGRRQPTTYPYDAYLHIIYIWGGQNMCTPAGSRSSGRTNQVHRPE